MTNSFKERLGNQLYYSFTYLMNNVVGAANKPNTKKTSIKLKKNFPLICRVKR